MRLDRRTDVAASATTSDTFPFAGLEKISQVTCALRISMVRVRLLT